MVYISNIFLYNRGMKIIFYSTPAYGHISPALPFMKTMAELGHKVYFYGTKEFRSAIEKTGAKYVEYAFDSSSLDLTIGKRLLVLEDTLLTYANRITMGLIREARKIKPDVIIHDNVALWGRLVGGSLKVETLSFNSFPTIPSIFSKAMLAYSKNFALEVWKDYRSIPHLIREKGKLWHRFHKRIPGLSVSMISNILNQEKRNILSFPEVLQPGSETMTGYYSLGACAHSIDAFFEGRSIKETLRRPYVVISLGTVFQKNPTLYREVIRQYADAPYDLVMLVPESVKKKYERKVPTNIHLETFLKQCELLEGASLFITAGGMNSVCQAAYRNVPCLLYPQQGEQRITAEKLCKLSGGKMLKNIKTIRKEGELLMKESEHLAIKKYFKEPDYRAFENWLFHKV